MMAGRRRNVAVSMILLKVYQRKVSRPQRIEHVVEDMLQLRGNVRRLAGGRIHHKSRGDHEGFAAAIRQS